jgi:CBS domain-containing protein
MSIERFTRKQVVTALPAESVSEVAEKMRREHVGAIVVTDLGEPIGIVTDRDLALRVVADGRSPDTPVREVMSHDLVVAECRDTVDQIIVLMRKTGVRRLPIVDDEGGLVGLVSLDDLYVLLSGELSTTAYAVLDNRGP